jgi:hypothetical protein
MSWTLVAARGRRRPDPVEPLVRSRSVPRAGLFGVLALPVAMLGLQVSAAAAATTRVTVRVHVSGPGHVYSDTIGGHHLDCPGRCVLTVRREKSELLQLVGVGDGAPPGHPEDSDYMVYDWSGDCHTVIGRAVCDLGEDRNASVSVRFAKRPEIKVKIIGDGTVEDNDDSRLSTFIFFAKGQVQQGKHAADERIDCREGSPDDCHRRWDDDIETASVKLIERPAGDDMLESWSGCDKTPAGGHRCELDLDRHTTGTGFKNMNVTATFGPVCTLPIDARDAQAAGPSAVIRDAEFKLIGASVFDDISRTPAASCPSGSISVTYSGTATASYVYNETSPVDNDQQQTSFSWSETGKFTQDGSLVAPETLSIQSGTVSETDPDNPSVDCTGTLEAKQATFSSGGPINNVGLVGNEIRLQAEIPINFADMVATGSGDCAQVPPGPLNYLVPPNGDADAAWAAASLVDLAFPSSQSSYTASFPVQESGTIPIGTCGCEGNATWSLQVSDQVSVTQ